MDTAERGFVYLIPSQGVAIGRFKLERPAKESFYMWGKPWLTVEFKLVSTKTATIHRLANPSFYRQFRCFVGGETGIDDAQGFWRGAFKRYRDGSFGYILS